MVGAGRCPTLLALGAMILPALAAGHVDVERGDLYLHGGRLASGAWGCGFAILANHRTRDDPHAEWDISVEQVNNGRLIKTSVTAASFTVARKSRIARATVAGLSFVIDEDPLPVALRFENSPDTDGVVRGDLTSDQAARLFGAVDAGSFITVTLSFPGADAESLRFHFVRNGGASAPGALTELCRPTAARGR